MAIGEKNPENYIMFELEDDGAIAWEKDNNGKKRYKISGQTKSKPHHECRRLTPDELEDFEQAYDDRKVEIIGMIYRRRVNSWCYVYEIGGTKFQVGDCPK